MIEILVVRDPDSYNEIRVWQNGIEVSDVVAIVSVDAGAGYDYEDWRDNAAAAQLVLSSDAARTACRYAYDDPPGKQYIDGWPDEDEYEEGDFGDQHAAEYEVEAELEKDL